MSTAPPAMPSGEPSKKKGPLFWILIGVGAFVLIGVLFVGVLGFAAWRLYDRAVGDGNPAFAAAKLALRLNPDLEILSEDPGSNSITVRDKSTGEVVTMSVDPESKTFQMKTNSGSGSVTIEDGRAVFQGQDGTTTIDTNSGGKPPDWLPMYPNTETTGTMVAVTGGNRNSSYTFKTSDSPEKVLGFYKEKLQAAGFQIPTTVIQPTGGMIMAEDQGNKRQVVVSLSAEGEAVLNVTERP